MPQFPQLQSKDNSGRFRAVARIKWNTAKVLHAVHLRVLCSEGVCLLLFHKESMNSVEGAE